MIQVYLFYTLQESKDSLCLEIKFLMIMSLNDYFDKSINKEGKDEK